MKECNNCTSAPVNQNAENISLTARNLPAKLEGIVQRWAGEKREFYLGPENMFFFRSLPWKYQNGEGIPTAVGAWAAYTGGCPRPRPLSRDEIDELQYELFKDQFPQFALMPVDYKCNCACLMCVYHGAGKENYVKRFTGQRQRLPMETIRSRFDKLVALGVKELLIGANGEIFLREDWEEVLRLALGLFTKIFLVTNGTLLDQRKLDFIKENRGKIGNIKVSLNALTFETWCVVNGVKNRNLYDTAMNAVETLADNYISVQASLVVIAENNHEVEEFVKYWAQRRVSINISNEMPAQELLYGNPEVDNSDWPYSACGVNSTVTVSIDGTLLPCCRTDFCPDDVNSYNLPLINIDDPVETIKSKWREALKNKAFAQVCRTCTTFVPRLDWGSKKESKLYGYKGRMDSSGLTIRRKRRKPLAARIAAEMNRFGQRVKKKLSQ